MKKIAFVLFFISIFNVYCFAFYDQEDFEGIEDIEYVEVATTNSKGEPIINSPAAVLYDRKYNRVLYNKNMNERRANASTTKILTAIVAYENGDLRDNVIVSQRAANIGGSTIRLRKGDEISLNDLLQGLLICSGNDAAVAIAEHIGGSVEDFCEMMNKKAKEIGAFDTNFMTPHGLDVQNHYSTAYDLAIMADYLLNIKYLADIVASSKANIKINNYTRTISTTNEMLSIYNGANGVKTGYTGDAGRCLVTSVTKDNWQLISVMLGCNTKKQRTVESTRLLNYGFNSFKFIDLCKNMEKEIKIQVYKSSKKEYLIKFEAEFIQPVTEKELESLKFEYKLKDNLRAPVIKGDEIGEIYIYINEQVIKTLPIVMNIEISRKTPWQYIFELLGGLGENFVLE